MIVDMAAQTGGNVEGTVAGEKIVIANGVTIIGYTDLAGRLPTQASQLYGQNMVNFLKLATPEKDGQLVLDVEDVVVRGMSVVHDGELHVATAAAGAGVRGARACGGRAPRPEKPVKAADAAGTKLAIMGGRRGPALILCRLLPRAVPRPVHGVHAGAASSAIT